MDIEVAFHLIDPISEYDIQEYCNIHKIIGKEELEFRKLILSLLVTNEKLVKSSLEYDISFKEEMLKKEGYEEGYDSGYSDSQEDIVENNSKDKQDSYNEGYKDGMEEGIKKGQNPFILD